MLSEEERRELRTLAQSAHLRNEFRAIKAAGRLTPHQLSIDDLVGFLNCLQRIQAYQPPPRPFPLYTNIRLQEQPDNSAILGTSHSLFSRIMSCVPVFHLFSFGRWH